MTWYAQQVFAEPKAEVISALTACPALRSHIFHVDDVSDFQTKHTVPSWVEFTDAEPVTHYETVRRGPQLPLGGLLVVREFRGGDDSHVSEWFGDDGVPWDALEVAAAPWNSPLSDQKSLFPEAEDDWIPAGFLSACHSLALSTRSVVSCFVHHMWGGDTEVAFGWVWDGKRESAAFYKAGTESGIHGVFVMTENGKHFVVAGDVLTLLLTHNGLLLSDGYFVLHTRSFPWDRYALDRQPT